ncbi:SDR family NAD(P)-dependent oxidoreductase [Kitasatospora arboriphila]
MSRILVTGSTDGLGRATAETLLSAYHRVVLHARNPERATALRPLLDRGADAVTGDFTDRDAVRRIAAELNDADPLDAVVHNAGVWRGPAVMPVNVVAPYLLTALLPTPRRLVYLSSGSHFGGHPTPEGVDWRGRSAAPTPTASCSSPPSRPRWPGCAPVCRATPSTPDGCRPGWAAPEHRTTSNSGTGPRSGSPPATNPGP